MLLLVSYTIGDGRRFSAAAAEETSWEDGCDVMDGATHFASFEYELQSARYNQVGWDDISNLAAHTQLIANTCATLFAVHL